MPTTDLKYILSSKIPAACHMMIQLDGRPIGLIVRLKLNRFAVRRPIAVVKKCDGVISNAPAQILIPNFPEYLFEGSHEVFLLGNTPDHPFSFFKGFSESSSQRD